MKLSVCISFLDGCDAAENDDDDALEVVQRKSYKFVRENECTFRCVLDMKTSQRKLLLLLFQYDFLESKFCIIPYTSHALSVLTSETIHFSIATRSSDAVTVYRDSKSNGNGKYGNTDQGSFTL